MKKARALLFIASLALMVGAITYTINRRNRENTKTADGVSTFIIAGTEKNGRRLFMKIDKKFLLREETFGDDLRIIKLNYKNLTPQPDEMSVAGDDVLVEVIGQMPDFLSGAMKSKADGNWIDPMYGNAAYPDSGEIRFGLSYRPQPVPGRPEDMWQRIYSKPGPHHSDFLIQCIPPISINSISAPEACTMIFNLPIAADLSKSLSLVVHVDFDVDRLSDWKNIEGATSSFLSSRIVYDAAAAKRDG